MGVQVAQASYSVVVQTVLADVAASYFANLRNLRRLDVFDANIARARALLELARNQLQAGVATQIDVTRAEAQVGRAAMVGGGDHRAADFVSKRQRKCVPGRHANIGTWAARLDLRESRE